MSASIAKQQLESIGIPAVIQDGLMQGLYAVSNAAIGGIRLQVSETNSEEATAFLSEIDTSQEGQNI